MDSPIYSRWSFHGDLQSVPLHWRYVFFEIILFSISLTHVPVYVMSYVFILIVSWFYTLLQPNLGGKYSHFLVMCLSTNENLNGKCSHWIREVQLPIIEEKEEKEIITVSVICLHYTKGISMTHKMF